VPPPLSLACQHSSAVGRSLFLEYCVAWQPIKAKLVQTRYCLLSARLPVYYTKVKAAHTWQSRCTGPDDTVRLAAAMGRRLRGGEVIELVSDLGGGKTTFVRGLAEGAGSQDTVSSPSFTLTNQYEAGELTIYHFDFYRLHEAGIVRDELAEVLADPRAVVVVEWAEITEDTLPVDRLTVTILPTGEAEREFTFQYPDSIEYLFPLNT
jgi:tRNA threonylcarbamoyladenosine biosynthesis protein TsaE